MSGWFKLEFQFNGQWWLDQGERFRRIIQCLKGIWTEENFNFHGDFYQFHDYPLKPKPVSSPERPHPEIFQGGNSAHAQDNGEAVSDYHFMNGNTLEGFQEQIGAVRKHGEVHGRAGQGKFAVKGFIISRETEAEGIRVLQDMQGKADKEAVDAFAEQVKNGGASSANKPGKLSS